MSFSLDQVGGYPAPFAVRIQSEFLNYYYVKKNKFLNIFPYSFCIEPASVAPFEWPDDITKWPKCRKKLPGLGGSGSESKSNANHVLKTTGQADHMVCEVIGHPCCIGK